MPSSVEGLDGGLFRSLAVAAHSYKRAVNDELSQHGVTLRQWQVLKSLRCENNVSVCKLAKCLRIKAPTLIGILRRMKCKGLIDLIASRSDRRLKQVRLSTLGQTLLAAGSASEERVRLRMISGLSDAEVCRLLTVLKKIRFNLESRNP